MKKTLKFIDERWHLIIAYGIALIAGVFGGKGAIDDLSALGSDPDLSSKNAGEKWAAIRRRRKQS